LPHLNAQGCDLSAERFEPAAKGFNVPVLRYRISPEQFELALRLERIMKDFGFLAKTDAVCSDQF